VPGGVIDGPSCHGGRRYFTLKLNRDAEVAAAAAFFEQRMPECKKKRQLVVWRLRWAHMLDHPNASWRPADRATYSTLAILPWASR
jgi:hypothetical protein